MKKLSVLLIVAVVIYLSHAWAKRLAYEQEELTIELVQKLPLSPDWGCVRPDPNIGCVEIVGDRVSLDQDAAFVSHRTRTDANSPANESSAVTLLFVRNDGVWTEDRLIGPGGGSSSSSVDGNNAAAGSTGWRWEDCWCADPRLPPNCTVCREYGEPGRVTLLSRSSGEWTSQTILHASPSRLGDGFGASVALDGDDLLVGDWTSVHVFSRDSGDWIQTARLYPPAGAGWGFGDAIAVEAGTALFGAAFDDERGDDAGAAYVYARSDDGVWTLQAKLLALDGKQDDFFGTAVSLDRNTALIGAPGRYFNDDRPGAAYVFVAGDDGEWIQQAKLLAMDGAQGDAFGAAVALDGNTALIGASHDDDNGMNSGSVYVFSRHNEVWTQRVKLLADDGEPGDSFGASVALDGETVLVGAPHPNQSIDADAPYVFRLVYPPSELVTALIEDVASLELDPGIENSLISKLDSSLMILTDLIENNDHAAVNILAAFINRVEAQQGKKIEAADADDLISSAQEIIDRLEE